MAKAAYYPFFHGPGRATTKMVWKERRSSGLELLILTAGRQISCA